jgi:chaperonin GroES
MTINNVKPTGNKVLVKMLDVENKTAGGVILSSSKNEKPKFADVLAVGNEVADIFVGDKVVIENYSGDDVSINGEKLKIVKDTDIIAKIEGMEV